MQLKPGQEPPRRRSYCSSMLERKDAMRPCTELLEWLCRWSSATLQHGQPIAFEGRKLTPVELEYIVGQHELLAVIPALHMWRCNLEGFQFTVVPDHHPDTFCNSVIRGLLTALTVASRRVPMSFRKGEGLGDSRCKRVKVKDFSVNPVCCKWQSV